MAENSLHILLVEDNSTDILLMREALEAVRTTAFTLSCAKRLDEALRFLQEAEVDAVLLDLGLPDSQGLDGFIRMQDEYASIPILILSGQEDEALAVRAVQDGAQDYLVKGVINSSMMARTIRYAIERKRSEQKMLTSEVGYRRLFETAQDGIFILDAETGQITDANPYLEELLGYKRSDLVGRQLWKIDPFRDKVASAAAFATLQKEGHTRYDDIPLINKDGTTINVEFITNVYAVGTLRVIQCNIRDITERKQAGADLRFQKTLLEAQSEASLDGILVVSDEQERRILYFNQRFVEMWEIPSEVASNGDDAELRKAIIDQVVAPVPLMERVEYLYDNRGVSSREEILLHNGRIFERYSVPITGKDGVYYGRVWYFRDISSAKQAEEALRRSHDELEMRVTERTLELQQTNAELQLRKTILESQGEASIDGILVVSTSGKVVSYNSHFAGMWGIAADIIATEDDAVIIQTVIQKLQDPLAFLDKVAYLYEHDDEISQEEISLVDGRIFDRYSAPVKAVDGTNYGRIWFFRDISERKEVELALRTSEEYFRQMTECVSEVFWMMDLDKQQMAYISPAFEEVWGCTCKELYDSPNLWTDSIHPDDRERTVLAAKTKQRQGEYSEEYRIVRPDGTVRWIHDRAFPVKNEAGEVYRLVGIAEDITERHLAQEAMQEAMQEADRANQAKSEFLSRMSHELRTPLNAILGFGQILDRQELPPIQKESVQYILKGGRHLLDLINEVLDIARVEAGNMELSLESVALADVVPDACALMRPLATEREVTIEEECSGLATLQVLADNQRLKQVLINLLSNGIKYNYPGGTVRIECEQAKNHRVRLSVSDSGWGIAPGALEKLFVPFERLSAKDSGIEGTGLGLALSQRLMIAMGGSLSVESVAGEGTTFTMEFAEATGPGELQANFSGRTEEEDARVAVKSSYQVLCIEDNLSNLRLLEVIFESRPEVTLLLAMQGSLGLELARHHEPDVILLDLNLPDIPGKEILERLQRSALTRDIPVIVISADATEPQVERLLAAGAKAYLTKPLDVAKFLKTFNKVLG